jgi:hypothetical protein
MGILKFCVGDNHQNEYNLFKANKPLCIESLKTLFHDIKTKNTKSIIEKLKSGININSYIKYYPAPFENSNKHNLNMILDISPKIYICKIYITSIIVAINQGDIELVKLLLDNGANINSIYGVTPLMIAIASNYDIDTKIKMVKLLLSYGANVNVNTRGDGTPLYYACEIGNSDIVKLIIENNPVFESYEYYGHFDKNGNRYVQYGLMFNSITIPVACIIKYCLVYNKYKIDKDQNKYELLELENIFEIIISYATKNNTLESFMAEYVFFNQSSGYVSHEGDMLCFCIENNLVRLCEILILNNVSIYLGNKCKNIIHSRTYGIRRIEFCKNPLLKTTLQTFEEKRISEYKNIIIENLPQPIAEEVLEYFNMNYI